MTESFAEKMKAGTRELNITLSQRQLEQFLNIMKCWWRQIK